MSSQDKLGTIGISLATFVMSAFDPKLTLRPLTVVWRFLKLTDNGIWEQRLDTAVWQLDRLHFPGGPLTPGV